MLSDMKTLTTRELNRRTARVLDALERGESFELRRKGKAVGYLTNIRPASDRKPDWKAHFNWLRKQPTHRDSQVLAEFEETRRRQRARDRSLENLE